MQRTRTTYNFSPELAAQLEAQLRQGHVARSDERLPGSNQKSPNEWIKQINEEFKLNIPLARVNPKGQIEWPNLYGVLYKKGGSITS